MKPASRSVPPIGEALPTVESLRLVRGAGRFVDDVELPGMLHGRFVRSLQPAGRLVGIDVSAALAVAGVVAVFTADDLGELAAPLPMLFPDPAIANARSHLALAVDRVRYAGEAVALVVATTRAVAEDAAELVSVEVETVEAVGDLAAAMAEDAPLVHADVPGNLAGTVRLASGDVGAGMAAASRIVRLTVSMDRGAAMPIETRGVVAAPDPADGGLLVWCGTQRPVKLRNSLAELLGLPRESVRVMATDVGGGFGPKGMYLYPEEVLCAWAALRLGRPVKWIEDRLEHFAATSQLREQVHHLEVGVLEDGTVTALRDRFEHDGGAYVPYGLSVPLYTAVTLTGPYRIPAVEVTYDVRYTNLPPTCPYRGSGGPFATFAIERALDAVAAELGLDRIEVRRRNLLAAEDQPWTAPLPFVDGRPAIHDGTPAGAHLDAVLEALDRDGLHRRRAAAEGAGRRLGQGVALYAEATGVRSYEGARVYVEASGDVVVATGTGSQGQGHETTLAQVAAAVLGVPFERVHVRQGDTGAFGWGRGTYGSKVAVIGGNAVALAATAVRDAAIAAAAALASVAPDELTVADGWILAGDGSRIVSLGELVERRLYAAGGPDLPGNAPGLDTTAFFAPERSALAAGAHGVELELDPATGFVRVLRYVAASDSGTIINPGVVDGQIRGAIAQGIGGALLEELRWSEPGVLANGTLVDYMVPRSTDVPDPVLLHADAAATTNPLGIKGAGEAGIFAVSAAVAAALEDALGCAGTAPFRRSPMPPEAVRLRCVAP